jgi:hypothetical protein
MVGWLWIFSNCGALLLQLHHHLLRALWVLLRLLLDLLHLHLRLVGELPDLLRDHLLGRQLGLAHLDQDRRLEFSVAISEMISTRSRASRTSSACLSRTASNRSGS